MSIIPSASTNDTTARAVIADLLWWSIPGSTTEEAKKRTEQMLDAYRAEVIAEASKHYASRIRFLEAELVRRPDRAGVFAELAQDVEVAVVPLTGAARDGADMVLRAIRAKAAEPTIPTVPAETEATA
ncbi:hypothetical protein ACIPJG_33765 [Streptomyces halstedii]|uniref:hypothetical protein n=1 Tax=Streptomyces halstedii TaxID=1944 RepID=UPI0038251E29